MDIIWDLLTVIGYAYAFGHRKNIYQISGPSNMYQAFQVTVPLLTKQFTTHEIKILVIYELQCNIYITTTRGEISN